MVTATQGDEVVDHGAAVGRAGHHVVEIGPGDRDAAPWEPTALIAGLHGGADARGDHRGRRRHSEDRAAIGEQEAQVRVAGDPADRLRGQSRRGADRRPQQPGVAGQLVVPGQGRDVGDDLDPGPGATTAHAVTTEERLSEADETVRALPATSGGWWGGGPGFSCGDVVTGRRGIGLTDRLGGHVTMAG